MKIEFDNRLLLERMAKVMREPGYVRRNFETAKERKKRESFVGLHYQERINETKRINFENSLMLRNLSSNDAEAAAAVA